MEVNYGSTVTILDEKGNRNIDGYVGYDASINVKDVHAEIYDRKGVLIKKLKKKDFLDVSAVDGGTLYSDSRVLFMSYLPVDYPYTVKFAYTIKTKNTGTIPSWYFINDFQVSIERSKYTLEFAEASLKPNILEKNFESYSIDRKETYNSFSYEIANVPALKDEDLRPAIDSILPKLVISPVNFYYEGFYGSINNWKEAGSWMNENLLEGKDELSQSTVSMANEIVSGLDDPLEKAKRIYRYVQENTRYISVQVGIGGLRPISAIEVDRLKYGDCKGLSNYTKALLKAVGVESYYVHVQAGKDKVDFEETVASFEQGNHVILAVPYDEKYYWIDCTSQVHPFGFLGDFTDDRKVLLMKPEGGEIAVTDAYLNEENQQITKARYTLNQDGGISGKINIKTKGIQYDQHFFLERRPKSDVEDHYKRYWANINNLVLKSYDFNNQRDEVIFEESVSVSASKYGTISNDKLIFVPNTFNNSQYVPKRYRNRRFPLEITRGYLDEDIYEIELPKNYTIESLPEGGHLETKFGEYSIEFKEEEGEIVVKRRLFIKEGVYSNKDYNLYRSFRRSIVKLDNSKTILTKKT